MMAATYDPQALLAAMAGESLRSVARRLEIDPAMFYRQWTERQADRYAIAVGLHPGDIWPHWWDGIDLEGIHAYPRSPGWRQIVAARHAAADGTARAMRRAALLTATEAARVLGVKPSRLRQWERGQDRPAGEVGERYAAFLAELSAVIQGHLDRSTLARTMQEHATDEVHPRGQGRGAAPAGRGRSR